MLTFVSHGFCQTPFKKQTGRTGGLTDAVNRIWWSLALKCDIWWQ